MRLNQVTHEGKEELGPSARASLIALYMATGGSVHNHVPKEFVAKVIQGGYLDDKSLFSKGFAKRGSGNSMYITKLGVIEAESILGIPPGAPRIKKREILLLWKKKSWKQ